MNNDIKLCKDCKFVKRNLVDLFFFLDSYRFAKCTHPSAIMNPNSDYYVTGNAGDYYYCSTQRDYECGKQGKYFQSKKGWF
jgi:hypothetical protein